LKVNDRQPSRKMQVMHILKFTNDTLPEQNKQAEKTIRELYEQAKADSDFKQLAIDNSDDAAAEMWVEAGKMVPEFESVVFKMEKEGDISEPFQTRFGWHIVKLLNVDSIAPFEDLKETIERQILRSDRAELITASFVDSLKKQYDFLFDEKNYAYLQELAAETDWTDSLFFKEIQEMENKFGKNSLVLFSYCDKRKITTTITTPNQRKETITYINDKRDFATFGDFVAYMQKRKLPTLTLNANIDAYIREELTNLKNRMLEEENSDFANLMREYHDGILLFNVSNKEVWEKASTDNDGLKQFYDKNKARYKWDEPRYKGQVFYCRDKQTVKQLNKILKGPADSINVRIQRLNKDSIVVKTNRGLFKKGANKAVDAFVFKTGEYQPADGFNEVILKGKVLKKYPESLSDIRGLVVQDYQNELEEKWVETLRTKYPITMSKDAEKLLRKK
jgi:peptidyl-prolyl cis-trans isomerase SurA